MTKSKSQKLRELGFIPFSEILRKELKNPAFKKAFLREMALVHAVFNPKTLRSKKMTKKQIRLFEQSQKLRR